MKPTLPTFAFATFAAFACAAGAAKFPAYDCKYFIEGVNRRATGAFRTEQDPDGRWWLVDPLGRGFLSFGVQGANWYGCYDPAHDRYAYRETNIKMFGTPAKWADDAARKYAAWGFNTLSFGCALDRKGFPRIRMVLFGPRLCRKGMPEEFWINEETRPAGTAFPNVFHPRFAELCAEIVREKCAPYRDDPWTIGYYLDNELGWVHGGGVPNGSPAFALYEVCMRKAPGHSARVAAEEWVRAHGADPAGKVPDEVKRGFLLEIARRYFKTTSEAVRTADPNHLVMGCRFANITGAGDDEVWNIAGEYCDVVSFNCYPMTDIDRNTVRPNATDGRSCREAFDALYARTKKPMIIPEWAFPALDSGLPCLHGAGQRFYTQAERSKASELWMRTLLQMPYIVGWAVFRWVDQPGGGAGDNGEDSNYGLVSEAGVPYPCVETFARIQHNAKKYRYGPPPEIRAGPSAPTRLVEKMLSMVPAQAGVRVGFLRDGDTFCVSNGDLVAEGRIGGNALLSRVARKGQEFGSWNFILHHNRASGRAWTRVARVTDARWERLADGGGRLDVTAEARGDGIAYRVKEGFTFTPGHPAFKVELQELANTGTESIDARRAYFSPFASFAGERATKDVQIVPNLWRSPKVLAWLARDGRFWGVTTDSDFVGARRFHVDAQGMAHPDFALVPQLAKPLPPGESYRPSSNAPMRVWTLPGFGGSAEWDRIVNAEKGLVRAKWSEFVSPDDVERVMANAHVSAKPLPDAQAIPLHDAGKTIVYDWETGDADDLLAAVGVGASYVRTSRPIEARAIIGAAATRARLAAATDTFRVRDPFILADDATRTYYLYETTDPYKGRPYARGVSVRTSKDLAAWSQPRPVMSVPPSQRCRTVWAPEVYKVRNRYLMFATLSFYPDREGARGSRAQDKTCRRGTWIYEASSPAGPFKPVSGKPATPEDMMALDGTFFMDGDRPYMVFCHEWVQTMTGGVCVAALKADFTGLAETPRSLFDATAASPKSRVTDGPCLHRMKDGRLFMIWSTSRIREGYCVMQTESASGTVYGPWKEHKVIYGKNGGHGSLFRTFEGELKLVLHGPNRRGLERLRILDVTETADGLTVTEPPPGRAVASRPPSPAFPPYDCKQFIPDVTRRATGAFRTEQDSDGRWWLVDPLGRGFLSFGVQSANWSGCYDPANNRYAYRETNIKQFGTPEKWAEDTIRKYTDWGFNTLSFGCGSELDGRGVPRIRVALFGQRMCHLGMPEEYWINAEHSPAGSAFPNVFHPRFAEICSLVAKWMCAPYKDDPWTIGYYLDNELAWGRGKTAPGVPKPFALFEVCMRKKPGHSARVAAEEWVRAHGADPAGKVPDEVKRGFLLEIARRYFKTTSEAVRAADPNHLVMGCRFAGLNGAGDDEVWNIAGEYCDVVSFNCYPMTDIDRNTVSPNATDGRSCREVFDALYARTKKPMIIPEWAFPALDSGLPCLHGAGQRFYTQAERTQATELWMRTLLPMPYIVGWAVFRWVDQPRGGAGGNGEDSNYGLVNEAGVPYPCVETFARIQKNAKALRYAPPPETREAPPISTRVVDEMLARIPPMGGSRSCATANVSFVRDGDTFRVTNGGLVAEGRIGGETLLANVALDGRTLGKWDFMIHHDRDSVRRWTHASRVTAADWEPSADGGGRLVVTAEGLDSDIAFRVKEGFTFTPGHPAFRAEVLAFENIGRKPITMRRFYFCPVAPFAGEVPAKEAQPVPNLWRAPKASAWIAKDGRIWGVVTDAERMGAMNFHVDPKGGAHSDFAVVPLIRCERRAETLLPGESYVPEPDERMRAWAIPGFGGAAEWRRITSHVSR